MLIRCDRERKKNSHRNFPLMLRLQTDLSGSGCKLGFVVIEPITDSLLHLPVGSQHRALVMLSYYDYDYDYD